MLLDVTRCSDVRRPRDIAAGHASSPTGGPNGMIAPRPTNRPVVSGKGCPGRVSVGSSAGPQKPNPGHKFCGL